MKKHATIMIIALLLIMPSISYRAEAQVSIGEISYFDHQMILNDNGFVLVNDTLVVVNEFESPATLPSINMTYPRELYDLIKAYSISPDGFVFEKTLTENSTEVTISPPQGYTIQPGDNVSISIRVYLVRTFSPIAGLNYSASIPLVPALSLPINRVDSSLALPPAIFFSTQHENFTSSVINNRWTLKGTFYNVSEGSFRTDIVKINVFEGTYFALLEFTEAKREFIISPLGSITVRDTITMVNYDNKTISKLKPDLLTEDFGGVMIIPPLVNPSLNPSSDANNKQVDLGTGLKEGERYTLTLEYPIRSTDFMKARDGLLELFLPLKPPVDGVVYDYALKLVLPEGFSAYSETEESRANASPMDGEQRMDIRLGLAWASQDIMPIASFVFIFALVALLIVGKPEMAEAAREIDIMVREYVETFKDRMATSKELADLYRKRQSGQVSKVEFKRTRQLLEERREKSLTRMNELKPKLVSLKPSLQEQLSKISDLHRDHDRVLRGLLNLYDQLYSKKVKEEVFDRFLPSHQRRINEIEESLSGGMDDLLHEVE
ncbi:MAG: hypothetical protein HXX80_05170 [Nitrososphaerales archaeon]|nr:hypothetical protein [Nitrososphaerales archaeon]